MKFAEIGFPRTGTRSLAYAVREVGIHSVHGMRGRGRGLEEVKHITHRMLFGRCDMDYYNQYDYVGNFPFVHWRQLARSCPDLKFILTVRNDDEWLAACARTWMRVRRLRAKRYSKLGARPLTEMHLLLISIMAFGSVGFSPDLWLDKYREHNRLVQEYFEGSPERLLVLRILDGEGWEKLCPFFWALKSQMSHFLTEHI